MSHLRRWSLLICIRQCRRIASYRSAIRTQWRMLCIGDPRDQCSPCTICHMQGYAMLSKYRGLELMLSLWQIVQGLHWSRGSPMQSMRHWVRIAERYEAMRRHWRMQISRDHLRRWDIL
jgi:hypothetical protein